MKHAAAHRAKTVGETRPSNWPSSFRAIRMETSTRRPSLMGPNSQTLRTNSGMRSFHSLRFQTDRTFESAIHFARSGSEKNDRKPCLKCRDVEERRATDLSSSKEAADSKQTAKRDCCQVLHEIPATDLWAC